MCYWEVGYKWVPGVFANRKPVVVAVMAVIQDQRGVRSAVNHVMGKVLLHNYDMMVGVWGWV